jgi:formate hydrogenlyase subunit 4
MEVLSMIETGNLISPLAALALSPLFLGLINRTKAVFAGRKGQPLMQVYFDLVRLFRKGSVFSSTTTWIFKIAPVVIFSSTLAAVAFIPLFPSRSGASIAGDLIFLLYFLGIARFFLILSALDTGSPFEGMGASREAFFSAMAEPVTILCLLNVMRANGVDTLGAALGKPMATDSIAVLLSALPLFIVLLVENARIPFDDPTTHLELTMIHEVLILDNSGPGLALMEYAAAIKIWLFSLIIGRILMPSFVMNPIVQGGVLFCLAAAVAVLVGVVESSMARVRLLKVPQLLFGAGIIALLGFLVSLTAALSR